MGNITVEEFEEKFERTEGLKLFTRASKKTQVPDYTYVRALDGNKTVSALKRGRLDQLLNGIEYEILTGDLEPAGGKMKVATVKKTYGSD